MLCSSPWAWLSRAGNSIGCTRRPPWSLGLQRTYAQDVQVNIAGGEDASGIASRDDGGRSKGPPTSSVGVVTTSTPQQTTIDELLDQLAHREEAAAGASQPGQASFLSLFLTPSYARHALDTSIPLRAFERLRAGLPAQKPLHALTGIVDRLPSGEVTATGEASEGLAYAFWQDADHRKIWDSPLQDSAAQKAGSISFEIETTRADWPDYTVQLPLAQTIFSTGRVSTLVKTSYALDADSEALQPQSQPSFLESHRFGVSFAFKADATYNYLRLVPLTPARRVKYCMGNIIRTVSKDPAYQPGSADPIPDGGDTQPASQELEAAVTSYFETCDLQPEPVSVWALVLPANSADLLKLRKARNLRDLLGVDRDTMHRCWLGESWMQDVKASKGSSARVVSRAIGRLLLQGARLHKVLSGGGGWGKKAGLLSLDPDTYYSTRELRGEEGWQVDLSESGEEQKKKALGEIVKEGEAVMFFLAPKQLSTGAVSEAEDTHLDHSLRASCVTMFGTVPSTMDDIPETSTHDASDVAGQPRIRHHTNFFGVLSEGGMALTVTDKEQQEITQTKLDVPHSRFTVKQVSQSTPGKNTSDDTSVSLDDVEVPWLGGATMEKTGEQAMRGGTTLAKAMDKGRGVKASASRSSAQDQIQEPEHSHGLVRKISIVFDRDTPDQIEERAIIDRLQARHRARRYASSAASSTAEHAGTSNARPDSTNGAHDSSREVSSSHPRIRKFVMESRSLVGSQSGSHAKDPLSNDGTGNANGYGVVSGVGRLTYHRADDGAFKKPNDDQLTPVRPPVRRMGAREAGTFARVSAAPAKVIRDGREPTGAGE